MHMSKKNQKKTESEEKGIARCPEIARGRMPGGNAC